MAEQTSGSDESLEAVQVPDRGADSATPLARVDGKPLSDIPRDLYIPPDALAVFLEAFEGPLDLRVQSGAVVSLYSRFPRPAPRLLGDGA